MIKTPTFINLERDLWLAERKKYLTATDIATIFGLNPYKSLKRLKESKTQDFEDKGLDNPSFANAGNAWEDRVLIATAKKYQFEIKHKQAFYADEKFRLAATLDAITEDNLVIEAKCTGAKNFDSWDKFPPVTHLIQVQTQLLLSEAKQAYLSAFFFENWPDKPIQSGHIIYRIYPNQSIHKKIIDKTKQFWDNMQTNYYCTKEEKIEMQNELLNRVEIVHKEKTEIPADKKEVPFAQKRIMKQTCLEQAYRILHDPSNPLEVMEPSAVVKTAKEIERLLIEVTREINDFSREFFIELTSSLKRSIDTGHRSRGDIKKALYEFLTYVTDRGE